MFGRKYATRTDIELLEARMDRLFHKVQALALEAEDWYEKISAVVKRYEMRERRAAQEPVSDGAEPDPITAAIHARRNALRARKGGS